MIQDVYVTRSLESHIKQAAQQFPAILLTGARQVPLYYYRDRDQNENDMLLMQDGLAYPLEIKRTASPGKDDVRHFRVLERVGLPIGSGGLICLADQSLPLTASTQSIPAWVL